MLSINFSILCSSIYTVPLRVCFLMIASQIMTPTVEFVVFGFQLWILFSLGFSSSFNSLFSCVVGCGGWFGTILTRLISKFYF